MINVKLLVFIVFLEVSESVPDYCEICPSHTLCLYKNPGPGPSCKSYDTAASLTKEDVRSILDKINQRRNFVALGHARNLPTAANMNKVAWSEELATFAQRWVDQCDVAVRPAAEDICRDLVDTYVGQNIATIIGLSPGLKVNSFVEMWFMQSLDYTGSVTYFNESEQSKTNHFTQLIWADTKYVGCGKARFSIDDRGTMIDRLVCNFAPRGNIQGKPIYTIGYPATQCDGNSRRDEIYSGLCKFLKETTIKITTSSAVSSLLRIVNLPNNSENDINLFRNNYKLSETNNDISNMIRHQKMRHIPNNTHFLQHEREPNQIIHEATNNPERHNVIPFQHTISQAQNVHGAVYRTRPSNDDFRRHDDTGQDLRKHYISRECTRKSGIDYPRNHCNNHNQNDQCTRRLQGNDYILTTQPVCCHENPATKITTNSPICECNSQTTCYPSTTPITCNWNCRCFNLNNCATANHRRIPGELAYYDNIPDFDMHSSNEGNKRKLLKYYADSSPSTHVLTPIVKDEEDYNTDYDSNKMRSLYFSNRKARKRYSGRGNSQMKQSYSHHLIRPFSRRKRLKRQIENPSAFWQRGDYDVQAEVKSLQYTTLPSLQRRKFRTNQRIRYDTEPITIKLRDVSLPEHDMTEKFLSFDELMHLRRDNGRESYDARRQGKGKGGGGKGGGGKAGGSKPGGKAGGKSGGGAKKPASSTAKTKATKATTTKAAKTKAATTKAATTVTANSATTVPTYTTTLFKSLKHCTRKVTCTWTAPTVTGHDGKVFTKGRGLSSRTPPGYVEGCSRTSTCTREFMNRNKHPSSSESVGLGSIDVTPTDEDYCERRSLDLQPRVSEDIANVKTVDHIDIFTENPKEYTNSLEQESTTIAQEDCPCDGPEVRKKRGIIYRKHPKNQEGKSEERPLAYNDLYFVILGKIYRMLENNKFKNKGCLCNESNDLHLHNMNYLLMFLLLYMF